MIRWTIAIADDADRCEQLAESLSDAWPREPLPCFVPFSGADGIDAAVIRDCDDIATIAAAAAECRAAGVPVLLVDDDANLADLACGLDAVVAPACSGSASIAGILFGMLQRQPEVSQLRGQVGLVSRLHGDAQEDLGRLQGELDAAASVQRAFMPAAMEPLLGVRVSTLWRPAGAVSGDVYDVARLDDTHVGIFLADAIGHGMSAGMLAMMLSRTLAAVRHDPTTGEIAAPRDVLAAMNTMLMDRNDNQARFATAVYAVVDCQSRRVTYAGAGHPPGLVVSADGNWRLIHSGGALLGVFDRDEFTQESLDLALGDRLLLYSDGLEQLECDDKREGDLPGHLDALRASAGQDDPVAVLEATIAEHGIDDLTMLCIEAGPLPGSGALRTAA